MPLSCPNALSRHRRPDVERTPSGVLYAVESGYFLQERVDGIDYFYEVPTVAYDPLFIAKFYSHFVQILRPTPRVQSILDRVCEHYSQPDFVREKGQWRMRRGKLYGYRAPDASEYRFHIGQWAYIVDQLERQRIESHLYQMELVPLPTLPETPMPLKPGWVLRDYQEPIVDYLSQQHLPSTTVAEHLTQAPLYSRFIGVQTGKGKTLSALAAAARLHTRVLVLIKPAYIEKWGDDVIKTLQLQPHDVMSVSGSGQLKGIIDLAQQGLLHSKVILLSTRTHQNYYKVEERWPGAWQEMGYGCAPEDLLPTLGIGLVLCDEYHQEFHANFKAMLYLHTPHLIAMSATLVHLDPFITRMYKLVFPPEHRYDGLDYDRYIKYYPVEYSLRRPDRVRTSEWGDTRYSHTAYEQSILRYIPLMDGYKHMLAWNLDLGYIKDYQPGDRAAVYASTIQMCTALCTFLQARYPHLTVSRYVEDDAYENVIEADIRVSTLGSSGTAIDIPGLRCVILTISVQSIQSNEQVMGRLRKLPDRDVKFYAWHASNIPKQAEYQRKRMELLEHKVASTHYIVYPQLL